MTPYEQIRFAKELTKGITNELLANIQSGRIPEERYQSCIARDIKSVSGR